MCIVLDTNIWSVLFDQSSSSHTEFSPVLKWITQKQGYAVYGGATYKKELLKAKKFIPIFSELKRAGRVKTVNDQMVDEHEATVKRQLNNPACDDSHLIAIFRVSGCRLLCSNDKRADQFIKDRALYPKGRKPPSIYRNSSHAHLLCNENIVKIENLGC